MPTRGEIGRLHKRILDCVHSESGIRIDIGAIGFEFGEWWKVKPAGEIRFEMVPLDVRLTVLGMRDRGSRVAVFPLHVPAFAHTIDDDAQGLWFSWFERWRKSKDQQFRVETAGWTVFFGEQRDDSKVQILRADWDNLESPRESPHGQPHWHVDGAIRVAEFLFENTLGTSLYEAIAIDEAHLGMGGWDNKVPGGRSPWQRSCGNDCGQIGSWACDVFKYVRRQLDPKNAVVVPR